MSASPPGWYPVPSGGRRYWDGSKWLELPDPDTAARVVPVEIRATEAQARAEEKRKQAAQGTKVGWGFIILLVLLVGGCVSLTSRNPSTNTTSTPSTSDASLACVHFRNVAGDISKGILTTQQIHDKAQEVYDNSSIAPADVQAAAQSLLSSTVADDGAAFLSAMAAMDKACAAHGT